MIKEIEQISHEMIKLNAQVYGAILSETDLKALEKSLIKIKSSQDNINNLLHEASLISITNTNELIKIVTKIHQLLTDLGTSVETIYELSDKFVCNYRDEWNIVKTNQA
jgi:hypothetical protein